MTYIDLHTHKSEEPEIIWVQNIFAQNLNDKIPDLFFSAGLHPWHLDQVDTEACFRKIEQFIINKNMLAIGECGLDRAIQTDFSLQEECFLRQVEIAEEAGKPLIIHCVRAYSDLIRLKKELKSNIPWIIHGFNANKETTQNLIKLGFYFSVGERLSKNNSAKAILEMIPIDQLFFETDNQDISIQKIYFFAAQLLRMTVEELSVVILNNFKKLFGDDKLVTKD